MPAVLETPYVRKRVRPEFGEAVTRLLQEHELSLRAARIRTGIDHVTISDMASGYVPRLEQLEAFARGFGLNVNEWRELAGYERLDEKSGAEILGEGIHALWLQIRRPIPIDFSGMEDITPEGARSILADLDQQAREGLI